jgi:capsular exopolysaccharide synthesis family protein
LRIENGKASAEFVDERMELTSWHRKASMVAESFRTTLTSILFSGRNGERPRVLVFTSASPKEGKTTVVCNLGISLAEIHHNVLLIDADMRRPRLHSVFDVPNDKGLSDLLFEDKPVDVAMLEKACIPTAIPRLYVMPSGGSRHNASSLVHSPRLTELIKLARERFDTVVIDTPPMVNISDARVVARLADAVILVLRSAFTTRDAALLATRRFAEDGIEVLGTILNYWNPKTPGYGYYRYYYSGYRNYYGKSDGIDANGNGNGNGHRRGVEVTDSDKA